MDSTKIVIFVFCHSAIRGNPAKRQLRNPIPTYISTWLMEIVRSVCITERKQLRTWCSKSIGHAELFHMHCGNIEKCVNIVTFMFLIPPNEGIYSYLCIICEGNPARMIHSNVHMDFNLMHSKSKNGWPTIIFDSWHYPRLRFLTHGACVWNLCNLERDVPIIAKNELQLGLPNHQSGCCRKSVSLVASKGILWGNLVIAPSKQGKKEITFCESVW